MVFVCRWHECLCKNSSKNQQKAPELISDYSKPAVYKINIKKSIDFLKTINEQLRFEIKNATGVMLAPEEEEMLRNKSNNIYVRSMCGNL